MKNISREHVMSAIADIDFPVSKDEIVEHAEKRRRGENVQRLLRTLPVAIYDTKEQIVDAIPWDRANPPEGEEQKKKQAQRTEHTKPGLAEKEKEIEQPAIEKELGENRGS